MPPATIDPTQIDFNKPVSSQKAESQLLEYMKGAPNPLDVYNEAIAQLGVPDVRTRVTGLRKAVMDTENLLNQVEGSVTGRTQGSLVTEAQRQRLVSSERQPLIEAAQGQYGELGRQESSLQDLLGQAQLQSELKQQGFERFIEPLQFRYESALQREQEARRRKEADRQFKEAKRQFEANLRASRSGSGTTSKSPESSLDSELKKINKYYKANLGKLPDFYREKIIKQLTKKYKGKVSAKQIKALVYKKYIPDSLENKNQASRSNPFAGMPGLSF